MPPLDKITRLVVGFLAIVIFSINGAFADSLKTISVDTPAGAVSLKVEVADTHHERVQGLMHRQSLNEGQGMLFIFPDEAERRFWMKNTPLSLDILFFDAEGEWVNSFIKTRPNSLKSLKSTRPAQYAIEVSGGEAERLGLGEGSKLNLQSIK